LFHTKTVKEQVKDTKREVSKAQRDLDRDKRELEREEQKLISQIKAAAKKGDNGQAKILAKQLVQVRGSISKLSNMNSQMNGLKTQATMMGATSTMAKSMTTTTKAMSKMTQQMDPAHIQKMAVQMQTEMEKANITEEMMDETLSGVFDDAGADAEADAITQQVLDELGVSQTADLHSVPAFGVKSGAAAEEDYEDIPMAPSGKIF